MDDENAEYIQQLRRKLIALEFRAKSDSAFMDRLRRDTVGTLEGEGFSTSDTARIAGELRGDTTLADEEMLSPWCDGITCILTGCHFFTGEGPNPPED